MGGTVLSQGYHLGCDVVWAALRARCRGQSLNGLRVVVFRSPFSLATQIPGIGCTLHEAGYGCVLAQPSPSRYPGGTLGMRGSSNWYWSCALVGRPSLLAAAPATGLLLPGMVLLGCSWGAAGGLCWLGQRQVVYCTCC